VAEMLQSPEVMQQVRAYFYVTVFLSC